MILTHILGRRAVAAGCRAQRSETEWLAVMESIQLRRPESALDRSAS
jgi:hypothetical protein